MIQVAAPDIGDEEKQAVLEVLSSGQLAQVFVNGHLIGGLEDLQRWNRKAA